MSEKVWTVADAKSHFSEVLERARADGPQTITKNGRETAVVVSAEDWRRKQRRKGSLAKFLLRSPLRAADLDLDRPDGSGRDIEL